MHNFSSFEEIISMLTNKELIEKTRFALDLVYKKLNIDEDYLKEIPFSLLIPNSGVSLHEHTLKVVEMSVELGEEAIKLGMNINRNWLIIGALLHDIGTVFTIGKKDEKTFERTEFGLFVPQNFIAASIAFEANLPPQIIHIIATSPRDFEGKRLLAEAIIISEADYIFLELLKTRLRGAFRHG